MYKDGQELEIGGFFFDHKELTDTIDDIRQSGAPLHSVTCSMYDNIGEFIKERDITRLFEKRFAQMPDYMDKLNDGKDNNLF